MSFAPDATCIHDNLSNGPSFPNKFPIFFQKKMTEKIHVEVYLNDGEKTYMSYESEDKDDIVLFSTFIFPDCLHVFGCEEKEKILFIPIEEIKKRLKILKLKIIPLPENIEYQISHLIRFIEKNIEKYRGIRTIYSI